MATWLWVDVEEKADLIDPLDLENFPTLLITQGARVTFFGPLTPQPDTLQRMLQAKLAADAPSIPDPDALGLLKRLSTSLGIAPA
jgi:thioredoxin 1